MESQVRGSLLRERLMATLSGFFGGLAALLATIGLYGVMSYMVAQAQERDRHPDGARRRSRATSCGWSCARRRVLLAAGVVVGLVAARWSPRGRRRRCCSGCSPAIRRRCDGGGGAGVVAMLASYLPALRASRLEPTEALREE